MSDTLYRFALGFPQSTTARTRGSPRQTGQCLKHIGVFIEDEWSEGHGKAQNKDSQMTNMPAIYPEPSSPPGDCPISVNTYYVQMLLIFPKSPPSPALNIHKQLVPCPNHQFGNLAPAWNGSTLAKHNGVSINPWLRDWYSPIRNKHKPLCNTRGNCTQFS